MVADVAENRLGNHLRLALREALKARDMIAVSALRSALASIDNASAVPGQPPPAAGGGSVHVAGTVRGVGAGEAERRQFSDAELEEIVRAEITERQAAARAYTRSGHADQAGRLGREARVLMSALDEAKRR
jgi:uncharacterized protein YqeY